MTVTLGLQTELPPQFRIFRRKQWASTWDLLPMLNSTLGLITHGFFVEEFWRSCIPEQGQATFRYDFGTIDGRIYPGGGPDDDLVDLIGQIIRIQVAPGSTTSETPAWRTVWVGRVEQQQDTIAPGANALIGKREYHCQDLLASYTKRQPLNRHGMYVSGNQYAPAYGHPGYNGCNWDGRILGNRERTNVQWYDSGPWSGDNISGADKIAIRARLIMHAPAGISTNTNAAWTDLQAVDHALTSSREPNTPYFYVKTGQAATDLLGNTNAWPIDDGMMCWDFLTDVFKRQRSRGLAFLDWDDDSGSPSGDLTVYVRINPQIADNITYTAPSGTSVTIHGASDPSIATTTTVDLVGDHRNISTTFNLGDRYQHVYDYVESLGEKIEVLATLDYTSNTLEKRWSSSEESSYASAYASSPLKVLGYRYQAVYQLHGLLTAWQGVAGNGNGASTSPCDYRCDDSGAIKTHTNSVDTATDVVTVMNDLPLYVGYDYSTATPTRYDGGADSLAPSRRPPLFLIKTAGDTYQRLDMSPYSCSARMYSYGIELTRSADTDVGTRYFSGVGSSTGGVVSYSTSLVFTVCLQMPYRVRMATANGTNPTRRKQLFHRGLHLWLAHPGAIWDTSETVVTANVGSAGKRNAGAPATGPGILRDDRDKLAREHALATNWYLTARRTATWQLKACGFLQYFFTDDGNGNATVSNTYPTIGQLVTTMNAAGEVFTINTPITKVHFTNRSNGVTTWITDWSDLDLR